MFSYFLLIFVGLSFSNSSSLVGNEATLEGAVQQIDKSVSVLDSLNGIERDCSHLSYTNDSNIIKLCMEGVLNFSEKQIQPNDVLDFIRLECSKIDTLGEAYCIGGVLLNKSINPILMLDTSFLLCEKIKTKAEGICLRGYYSNKNISPHVYLESARNICKNYEDEGIAFCLSGFLSNPNIVPDIMADDAKSSCGSVANIYQGRCIGFYIAQSDNPSIEFNDAKTACRNVVTEVQSQCMIEKFHLTKSLPLSSRGLLAESECIKENE